MPHRTSSAVSTGGSRRRRFSLPCAGEEPGPGGRPGRSDTGSSPSPKTAVAARNWPPSSAAPACRRTGSGGAEPTISTRWTCRRSRARRRARRARDGRPRRCETGWHRAAGHGVDQEAKVIADVLPVVLAGHQAPSLVAQRVDIATHLPELDRRTATIGVGHHGADEGAQRKLLEGRLSQCNPHQRLGLRVGEDSVVLLEKPPDAVRVGLHLDRDAAEHKDEPVPAGREGRRAR